MNCFNNNEYLPFTSELKDTFSFAQELNAEEIEEYEAKRSENLKQRLANFSKERPGFDGDFFEKFPTSTPSRSRNMFYNGKRIQLDPQDKGGEHE